MSATMTAQFVADALVSAIWRRGKARGRCCITRTAATQYASNQFRRLMVDYGIVCSTSRAGNVWDDIAMKSFFSSLKTERSARETHRTRDPAKADVLDYIERFYNARRRHWTIGYLGPMEFEKLASLAWHGVRPTGSSPTCEALATPK
jgi:putative transposase